MTRVLKVNGCDPVEWQKNQQNVYCGRRIFLRAGVHVGKEWVNLGFANHIKFESDDNDDAKRKKLFRYVQGLKASLAQSAILRTRFSKLHGKNLGCWCVNWDGNGRVPLCHAAWLARIVDLFAELVEGQKVQAVSVTSAGGMLPHLDVPGESLTVCVIRRKW